MSEGRRFYERVCNLINVSFDTSTVTYYDVENTKYHIAVMHQKFYRNSKQFHKVSLTLVYDKREIVAREYLKLNSSDRVIMNRFNKLVALVA